MKRFLVLLPILFFLTSCDASKELDKAFANQGLARLNTPRTDFAPGAIILKGKKLTVEANNVTDYVPSSSLLVKNDDATNEIDAILPKIASTKNIIPSLAADFVASSLPVNGSLNLKFTSNVNLDQVNCRISSVKIAELKTFLRDPKNASLVTALKEYAAEKADIYIAYEVWSASKFKFTSSTGTDISAEAKIGEVKPILTSADPKFTYSKTSSVGLDVSGDKFYPFALRLAKVEINPQTSAVSVTLTNFKMDVQVKAAADEAYSSLPNANGEPLSIVSMSRESIKAALQ